MDVFILWFQVTAFWSLVICSAVILAAGPPAKITAPFKRFLWNKEYFLEKTRASHPKAFEVEHKGSTDCWVCHHYSYHPTLGRKELFKGWIHTGKRYGHYIGVQDFFVTETTTHTFELKRDIAQREFDEKRKERDKARFTIIHGNDEV